MVGSNQGLQNITISSTIEIMLKRPGMWIGALFILAYCIALFPSHVFAETLQSPNYKLDESSIGSDNSIQSSSANFKTDNGVGVGALSIGSSASANYQVEGGTKTSPNPTLSFAINNSNVDFGSFSTGIATTSTASFSISNYTSYGYAVQIIGKAPSNGNHTISAMTSTAVSQAGTEQFGINLVANTLPVSVGSNPDKGQFGFGMAAPNYAVSNSYRYVSGETIATSPKSSGITAYTISYLVNVNSLTPGGQYTSDQTIVVTGTY